MSENTKQRDSNIELYRIILMLVIVAHHYVVNSDLMNQIDTKSILEWKDYVLLLFGGGGEDCN